MAEELGRIEKPDTEKFINKRKLYLVPLLYSWESAPPEYNEKLNRYWQQVEEHVSNLESKMGEVNRIYHESITETDEEALRIIEKINPSGLKIINDRSLKGAVLEATENRELTEESMDWERHVLIGFISQKVADIVSQFFTDSSKKRYDFITGRIDESLQEKETALLFIREGHRIQFPADIEVFSIAPPALDDIFRWMRERQAAAEQAAEAPITAEQEENKQATDVEETPSGE
ncbi:hypothetical protein ACFLUG_03025 [Chloroflexota bacterium]